MDNVVYILGAGFSATHGLPVMSNFLSKAKDLFYQDIEKYAHFTKILDTIRKNLAYVNLFYDTDLTNIEEVLSILEMQREAGMLGEEDKIEFVRFILDVIQYYTPTLSKADFKSVSKGEFLVEPGHRIYPSAFSGWNSSFTAFILGLFNKSMKVNQVSQDTIELLSLEKINANYSVITLNYDLLLENYAGHVSNYWKGDKLEFVRPNKSSNNNGVILVKLHGSVDDQRIIPPTWNKHLNSDIDKEWKTAFELLSKANCIRILGYSLPESDAYVRYLLYFRQNIALNLKKSTNTA